MPKPIVQAAELLLQERMPRDVAVARPPPEQVTDGGRSSDSSCPKFSGATRRRIRACRGRIFFRTDATPTMMTAAGSGYSRWHDVAMTRWREDATCDGWGSYIFLRDVRSGEVWSAGYQPTGAEPDTYEVTFSEDRAEIVRRDGSITTTLEVVVSPEDDAEVRRVSITNHGDRTREIELTSYAEIALARQADDVAHPAFAKLFVETEFVPNLGAILATAAPAFGGRPASLGGAFGRRRRRNLGRRAVRNRPGPLSGTRTDHSIAGRHRRWLAALQYRGRRCSIRSSACAGACAFRAAPRRGIAFWTMAASSREEVLDLADKHHDAMAFERATTLAWTQAQMQLHHLGISRSTRPISSSASPIMFSIPIRRCGRRPTS